ncbi:winged helix-turn-helix transcriptional regulator [uncultured Sphingomonas sp.]|uniref:winged helix-turn-helix transcriptional regulator n=1 Tax=uncultured Sphingomonas sp. TaxID=158754 RepID=UPI00345C000D
MCVETNLIGDVPLRQAESDEIFHHLTRRWVLQILMALNSRQMRFTCLRRAIPKVSANVLTARLRELETARLITRTNLPPPTVYQVYELGPLAQDLRPALDHLEHWKLHLSEFNRSTPLDDEQ